MFFAIVLIAIGLAILLNALGLLNGSFWGFFWAILFIAFGVKMLIRQGKCPVCGWHYWEEKIHGKIHQRAHRDSGNDEESNNE